MNKGKIVQVMGAIVDVKFDNLPKINNQLISLLALLRKVYIMSDKLLINKSILGHRIKIIFGKNRPR